MGSSLVEEDKLELAKELTKMAEEKGVELILPTDVIVADKFDANANTKTVKVEEIPDGKLYAYRLHRVCKGQHTSSKRNTVFSHALCVCKPVR